MPNKSIIYQENNNQTSSWRNYMTTEPIEFRTLLNEDCHLLHLWLQEPHVREFWDDGNRSIEQTRSYYYKDNNVDRFIFSINNHPVGYIQSYDVKLSNEYKKFSKNNYKTETVGVDFFIGDKNFIGKGFAKIILQDFIKIYCSDASRILVDPEAKNSKAIHVYETCGFVKHTVCFIRDKMHAIMFYETLVNK